ncbi:hypothetical protein K443DRAFT_27289, partial [Laccaria amethystina LaAM-08-1]
MIDFNQTRPWSRKKSDIDELVEALYVNDHCVRPRPEDPLYRSFVLATWMRIH